jgi:dihydroneopterin aldolase
MEQDSPKDIYRIAYDEAFSELREILREFEQLRMQKDLVERVVEALKLEIGPKRQVAVTNHRPRVRCRVHTAVLQPVSSMSQA